MSEGQNRTAVDRTAVDRRAVITGIGVIAPNGIGTETYWEATKAGKSGITPIRRFDASKYATQLAGEVEGFNAPDYIEQRLIVQTDRWTWMGLAATQMALRDAQFDPANADPVTPPEFLEIEDVHEQYALA